MPDLELACGPKLDHNRKDSRAKKPCGTVGPGLSSFPFVVAQIQFARGGL